MPMAEWSSSRSAVTSEFIVVAWKLGTSGGGIGVGVERGGRVRERGAKRERERETRRAEKIEME